MACQPACPAQVFQGKTVKVPVCTGPDGVAEFKRTVCKLFNLPGATALHVHALLQMPGSHARVVHDGVELFDAACTSVRVHVDPEPFNCSFTVSAVF